MKSPFFVFIIALVAGLTACNQYQKKITIGYVQITQDPVLDAAKAGVFRALSDSGFVIGQKIKVIDNNAQGDMPTANTIARTIVNEKFNIVVTISTPALQVMANANKDGGILHVFCAVTDPFASGVGISGSEAGVICRELGIEFVETSVENASQVYEAALAICSKGVEALWIGGDNVIESAIDMYIEAARKNRKPLFSNSPNHAMKGSIASLGANYYQVGQTAGDLVISLLNGLPASQIQIKNMVPERLFLNDSVRIIVKDKWIFPEDLIARADSIIR
jgi:ABC-type uncharacterized transport system substrate-binding protein